jgi:hypothetical protein
MDEGFNSTTPISTSTSGNEQFTRRPETNELDARKEVNDEDTPLFLLHQDSHSEQNTTSNFKES